jgi:hypothetical protein
MLGLPLTGGHGHTVSFGLKIIVDHSWNTGHGKNTAIPAGFLFRIEERKEESVWEHTRHLIQKR